MPPDAGDTRSECILRVLCSAHTCAYMSLHRQQMHTIDTPLFTVSTHLITTTGRIATCRLKQLVAEERFSYAPTAVCTPGLRNISTMVLTFKSSPRLAAALRDSVHDIGLCLPRQSTCRCQRGSAHECPRSPGLQPHSKCTSSKVLCQG